MEITVCAIHRKSYTSRCRIFKQKEMMKQNRGKFFKHSMKEISYHRDDDEVTIM